MTTLLEQAFTAATQLPQERQDELAQLILQEISRPSINKSIKHLNKKAPSKYL